MNNKYIGLPDQATKWYKELLERERLNESNGDFLNKLEQEQAEALNKLSIAVENGLNNLRANVIADYTSEIGMDLTKQVDKERLRAKNFKQLTEANTGNSLIAQLPIDLQYALENDDETESPDYLSPVFEALSMAIDVIKEVEKVLSDKTKSDTIKLADIGIVLSNKWEKNKEELARKLSVISDFEKGQYGDGFNSGEQVQYNK